MTTLVPLDGKWVGVNTKTDTLIFGSTQYPGFQVLNRGNEMRGGYLLPKLGSGLYFIFKLSTGEISLSGSTKSNLAVYNAYFNQIGNKIIVGNFYGLDSLGIPMTFKKLK